MNFSKDEFAKNLTDPAWVRRAISEVGMPRREKTYAEKLENPRWVLKRKKILQRDHYRCRKCDYDGSERWHAKMHHICDERRWLEVHHLYYNSLEPWEYSDDALITLCNLCHEEETENPTILKPRRDMVAETRQRLIEIAKESGFEPTDELIDAALHEWLSRTKEIAT